MDSVLVRFELRVTGAYLCYTLVFPTNPSKSMDLSELHKRCTMFFIEPRFDWKHGIWNGSSTSSRRFPAIKPNVRIIYRQWG